MRLIEAVKVNNLKKIKLLGIDVYKRSINNSYKEYYLFGIKLFKKSLIKVFYNKYKHLFDPYDSIYVLNSNIGECYLIFKYFANNWIGDNTLFVATKKYHIDIIKTFLPDCNFILNSNINLDRFPDKFEINDKKFQVLFNHDYYVSLEKDIREKDNVHYFGRMSEYLGEFNYQISNSAVITSEIEKSLEDKVRNISLNLNNFIFISPEANSCLDIDDEVRQKLETKLKEKGYDTFWNIMKEHPGLSNIKKCFLTLEESFLLCSKAKYFISLRSGLAEFLVDSKTPSYIIYSEFKNRSEDEYMSADRVLRGFTLKGLPQCNSNIKELVAISKNDYESIIEEIVRDICQKLICQ